MRISAQFVRKIRLLTLVIFFVPVFAYAQSSIKGWVRGENGPLPFASVVIEPTGKGALADANGAFVVENLQAGNYDVTVSLIGYETVTIKAEVPGADLRVILNESQQELQEVVIEAKSDGQLALEQPIKTSVIDTKVFAVQPSTMIELLNRSVGVRVRQTGGLGSNANMSLNGFEGNAIKYFRDGIPMDYLGAGYSFSLVPVNMLERLEIYKGVLPVSLGADALGGALNMATKKFTRRYVEASYELGSFNTHRASVNVFLKDPSRPYFVGADAFFNYSDNDYEVTAPVEDREHSTISNKKVRLFHNTFRQYYGEIYGGVRNVRWADELRIGLTAFSIDRDNQYGSRITETPFGASTSKQSSVIPTIRYQKSLLNDRFFVDQFLVANTIVVEQVDTVRGTYGWNGEFIPSGSRRGEVSVRGSLSKTNFSVFTSRTYASFNINDDHKIEMNAVFTNLGRKGRDPLGQVFQGSKRDILSVPASYNKSVISIGLESKLLEQRITNNLIAKYYRYNVSALEADYYGNEVERSMSNATWGFAEALKITTGQNSYVRLSGEMATRLPEQEELFGDGNLHVANFALKPERSLNINAGYRTDRINKFSLEVNSFYRITRDRILNVPHDFLFNQHQNIENVKGLGLEVDASVNLHRNVELNGNFTYQDFRLFDTGVSAIEGSRLKHTPYFFANLGINISHDRLFSDKDRIAGYWYYTFVRQYYLDLIPRDREPDGFLGLWGDAKMDAPNVIPDQNVHFAGLTYTPIEKRLTLGVQVKNIFDAEVYDNFKIQNMGRSYHIKLTYTLD